MGSDVCVVAGVFMWVPFVRFLANPRWHARHTLIHNFWPYLTDWEELLAQTESAQNEGASE